MFSSSRPDIFVLSQKSYGYWVCNGQTMCVCMNDLSIYGNILYECESYQTVIDLALAGF